MERGGLPSYEEGLARGWYDKCEYEDEGAPAIAVDLSGSSVGAAIAGHASPCSMIHKWPAWGATLVKAGAVVQLCVPGMGGPGRKRGKKMAITCWSRRSRFECWRRLSMLPWEEFVGSIMIVLTYPGRGNEEWIPRDGRTAKRQLRRFLRRWRRRYGESRGVWKMEFQERGGEWEQPYWKHAPHFHIWIGWDHGQPSPDFREMWDWVARSWAEVIGCEARTQVRGGTARWAIAYGKGYLQKGAEGEYQNQVPEGFERPGRFWGIIGDFRPHMQVASISSRRAVKLRRLMVRYLKSRGVVRKPGGRPAGMTVVSQAGFPHQLWTAATRMLQEEALEASRRMRSSCDEGDGARGRPSFFEYSRPVSVGSGP